MNLKHRKIYAPEILKEISNYLDAIESKEDLLPKSDLQVAVTYIRNEWSAIENLFRERNLNSVSKQLSLYYG